MNKKGFTLIELLAVIVVLAVIALIAIPLITNVIDKARLGALKDSAYGILDAGELYIANNLKEGIPNNLTFTCNKNKCTSDDKEINYKGNINEGTLIITTDSKTLVCVDNGKNYALKLADEKEVTTGEGTCGSYEEANGSFNIVEATSARIEELEQEKIELQDQINKLETLTNDYALNYNIQGFASAPNFWAYGGNSQPPENAFDGIVDLTSTENGHNHWIAGENQTTVGTTLIYAFSNDKMFNLKYVKIYYYNWKTSNYKFKIQGQNSSNEWVDLSSEIIATKSNEWDSIKIDLKAQESKAVRLYFTGGPAVLNSVNTYCFIIAEVELHI